MKIEKLKKNHKKEVIGGLIVISVIGILAFNLTKARYQRVEDIRIVEGNINYKPYDFKMMAMYKSDNGTSYTEITGRMPSSGYVINESKSYCTLNNVDKDTNVSLYTKNGEHIIKNLSKNEKCYLYFDNVTAVASVSDLANKVSKTTKTDIVNFTKIATSNEGIYQANDSMYGGVSYYWRGAVTNNYVKFGGYCWRIIRINGDGTMRLIYDGTTCHANGTSTTDSIVLNGTKYNSNYKNSEYVGWKYTSGAQRPSSITSGIDAPIKTALENWYNTNIGNITTYSSKVADGKYCNDRSVEHWTTWDSLPADTFYYSGYNRIVLGVPKLSCSSGDTYTMKVGLITSDEVNLAGGKGENNTSYYLYNGQKYWTMSPNSWFKSGSSSWAFMSLVDTSGRIAGTGTNSTEVGIRPVINLKSNAIISRGAGTRTNPYVV